MNFCDDAINGFGVIDKTKRKKSVTHKQTNKHYVEGRAIDGG